MGLKLQCDECSCDYKIFLYEVFLEAKVFACRVLEEKGADCILFSAFHALPEGLFLFSHLETKQVSTFLNLTDKTLQNRTEIP